MNRVETGSSTEIISAKLSGFLGLKLVDKAAKTEPEIPVNSDISGEIFEVLDLDPALGSEGPSREVFDGVDQE